MSVQGLVRFAFRCQLCKMMTNKARVNLFGRCHALSLDPIQENARCVLIEIERGRLALLGLPTENKIGKCVCKSKGGKIPFLLRCCLWRYKTPSFLPLLAQYDGVLLLWQV